MHDGMQYDPIQDQSQGHEPFKVGNPATCESYLPSSAIYNGNCRQLTIDSLTRVQCRNLIGLDF